MWLMNIGMILTAQEARAGPHSPLRIHIRVNPTIEIVIQLIWINAEAMLHSAKSDTNTSDDAIKFKNVYV